MTPLEALKKLVNEETESLDEPILKQAWGHFCKSHPHPSLKPECRVQQQMFKMLLHMDDPLERREFTENLQTAFRVGTRGRGCNGSR